MTERNILISGAGVAGITLAYWLRRHGFRPTVVERAEAPRRGGHAIDIRGSALGVVERMGVLADIRRLGTDMRGMSWYNARGRKLVDVTEHTLTGGLVDSEDVEILRDELTDILYAATDGVEYVFGDSITGLTQTPDGVDVTFASGAPRTFDLVVGADGIHSTVRRLAFGPETRYLHHLDTYLSVFTMPNYLNLDRWQVFHMSPGRLAGVYSARGNTETRAMLGFEAPVLDYDHHDRAQQEKLIADAFLGGGWEIPRLLREMRSAPELYFDSMSQVRMDSWTADRVTLVGDAGYGPSPLSGQGTSLALVGAYVLAGELRAAHGDHGTAFARYTEIMRPFVLKNQELAMSNKRSQTRAAQWRQIQSLRALRYLPFRTQIMRKAMQPLTESANTVRLKDY
ncbi:FAD-dependent monooxygenase [Amycolatopsis sp. NPDC059021]|uniref:FAD-dependent monooxygenase n=1 Tax=Amycolatopsis sp. NPDC059021 TaxID=3346704 RepID=UPI0036727846